LLEAVFEATAFGGGELRENTLGRLEIPGLTDRFVRVRDVAARRPPDEWKTGVVGPVSPAICQPSAEVEKSWTTSCRPVADWPQLGKTTTSARRGAVMGRRINEKTPPRL
jgi:hypothetical protein